MPRWSEEDVVNLTKIKLIMTDIRNISIKNYLAQRGVTPASERAGYGMYRSPFRAERTPSFKVDYKLNLWYDFGADEGGSIIDLVMKLDNCTTAEAFAKLEGGSHLPIITRHCDVAPTQSPLRIERVHPLTNRHLLEYLRGRGIDDKVARHYCREVHYRNNGKSYYAIGFANDAGGYELRNEYFKGSSSPKSPTTIKGSSYNTMLFEGFIDMLSYMSMKGSVNPVANVCVLNSVNNLRKAEEFLKTQRTIHCFLDNDEAGRRALAQVEKLGVEVVDHSTLYRDFKDMNDYLKSKNQLQKPPRRGRKM